MSARLEHEEVEAVFARMSHPVTRCHAEKDEETTTPPFGHSSLAGGRLERLLADLDALCVSDLG
jgi:hypothetical protein